MQEAEAFLAAAFAEAEAAQASCTACGSHDLSEKMVRQEVPHGGRGEHFSVEVPVVSCRTCDFSYTDHRAERLRKEALYSHLGLLAPTEVKAIRKALGLSRKDFDAAYGLPPASVERWENGKLIQNRSMDTLLRALSNPATAARLDRRLPQGSSASDGDNVIRGRFRSLAAKPGGLDDARRRAGDFQLRAQG